MRATPPAESLLSRLVHELAPRRHSARYVVLQVPRRMLYALVQQGVLETHQMPGHANERVGLAGGVYLALSHDEDYHAYATHSNVPSRPLPLPITTLDTMLAELGIHTQ
jgi:hypothetical protein